MTINESPLYERTETVLAPPAPADRVQEPMQVGDGVVGTAPPVESRVRTSYVSTFAPDALIAAAVGLVLLVVGLIAIVRGGFQGAMSDPVFEVMGFTHTTTLGIIEIGLGAALLLSGVGRSRSNAMFFGTVLGIAGFVGAVQTASFEENLALESSMAWLAAAAGAFVVVTTLLLPRFAKRSTVIEQR
jgi:hypothetical protein